MEYRQENGKYGYTTFEVDVTDLLKDGENEIFVSITFQTPNSRWYTGAGIYRNVWLKGFLWNILYQMEFIFQPKRR